MNRLRSCLRYLLWLPCAVLAADYPDLPPTAQVVQVLRSYPLVRAAAAELRAAAANRDLLVAGPHEFSLTVASQQRRERALGLTSRDHEIGIERAIRLPGKATQDAALGALGITQAEFALGDALHESARLLLKSWFDWQREDASVLDWAQQVDLLRAQHEVVLKKVGAGETAPMERALSAAHLSQAEAQQAQAEARREAVASALAEYFPGLPLPATRSPTPPAEIAPPPGGAAWQPQLLEHNHELAVARSAAQRSRLSAQRLDAERIPDPTLGVKMARERDGAEHVIGLQLSIPFGGAARAASSRAGVAEADAAGAREALALARAKAEAVQTEQRALNSLAQWQRAAAIASRMTDNTRLLEKAWRLGEGQFSELQIARRQAIEARLAATQVQLDANEARYRLLLDAHLLWDLDADEH